MTTGGGARGVGDKAAGEEFAEGARGCWTCEVDPATSSDPLDGDTLGCWAAAEDMMAADCER